MTGILCDGKSFGVLVFICDPGLVGILILSSLKDASRQEFL